jgi:hypothetical protein
MSSSLLAAVTLAAAGEASIFSSRGLSATPKWFSGVQKVARNSNAQLLERATIIRGGAAPGEETAEETEQVLDTVEAQDLYLPGLLDTMITRTNKVRRVVFCRALSGPSPVASYVVPVVLTAMLLAQFIIYLYRVGYNSCIRLCRYSLSIQSQRIKAQGWQCRRGDWPSPSRRVRNRPNFKG